MNVAERFRLPLACCLLIAMLSGVSAAAPPAPVVSSTTLLKTSTTWNGASISYPRTENPEVQTVLVEIPHGAATAWHSHPVNNIAYLLEGDLRVEAENGAVRAFKAGDSFAELVNAAHRGVNVGNGPVRIVVVYFGAVGTPISVAHTGALQGKP